MQVKFLHSPATFLRNPAAVVRSHEKFFRKHVDVFFLLHSICRSHADACCRLSHGFPMPEKFFGIPGKNARRLGKKLRSPVRWCRKRTFFFRIPGFFLGALHSPRRQDKPKPCVPTGIARSLLSAWFLQASFEIPRVARYGKAMRGTISRYLE